MKQTKSEFRSAMAILAAILFSLSGTVAFAAQTPLEAADVPTFQLRARVTSCEGKELAGKTFTISLADVRAKVAGSVWSDWLAFGPKQAEEMLKRSRHPRFPVVTYLTIGGATDPTTVEIETRLKEAAPATSYTADLFGPRLTLVIWRDEHEQPHIASSAEYNQRYWEVFKTISIPEAERPKLFPIVDKFCSVSNDRKEWMDGFSNLARAGFNALSLSAHPQYLAQYREMLLKAGLHRTAGGIYEPVGGYFDFTAEKHAHAPDFATSRKWWVEPGKTTLDTIEKWAQARIAPYLNAGFKPEDMAMYFISDEPGWTYPMMFKTLSESPEGLQHFHDYLKAQGLTPADVGAASWEQALPLGRSKAVDLPSRRLFYWTIRFFSWDSARHFANCARALENASYPNMPIFANWSSGINRLYSPGASGHNPDTTSADGANGCHDWLEFGRMRGGTMLWTEDWFSDTLAYQWSYFSAVLRCGAEKSGGQFGGYIVPTSAGQLPDGILQKILTLIGSGAKGLEYFIFGPEYNFPGNCYSEKSEKVLPKMAEAHRMIGKAEDLLWPGTRPRAQVAILHPRSAEMWDERNIPIAGPIAQSADYIAEEKHLYLALQHADIPADFVEEDDLSLKGLAPYKVLYVTEPNIPAEFQQGLLEWVQQGGTVVTVTGAGAADRYDDPCDILSKGLGITEQQREREYIYGAVKFGVQKYGKVISTSLKKAGEGTGPLGNFTAFGPRGTLVSTPKEGILASFSDGTPAIIERTVGNGRVVHFTWLPGFSYFKSSGWEYRKIDSTTWHLPVGFSTAIRGMITYPVKTTKVVLPVTVNQAMIETPMLLSEKGAAVTLLNWTGAMQKEVQITVRVPFKVKSVESIKQGNLAFRQTEQGVICTLPLGAADIVLLRP